MPAPLARVLRFLLVLGPALAVVGAHVRGLSRAWSGAYWFGYPTGMERCDVLFTLKLALDTRLRAGEYWEDAQGVSGVLHFLTVDLWQTAVDARALNLLDFVILLWPVRDATTVGAGLVIVQFGILLSSIAVATLFARSVGASWLGAAAGGLVAGCSGLVLDSLMLGQFQQALLPFTLAFFAGLVRLYQGQRGGVVITVLAASTSALLYWQNPLILGLGSLVLLAAAWRSGWTRNPHLLRDMAVVVVACTLICLPGALPILHAMGESDSPVSFTPWGTAYPWPGSEKWDANLFARLALLDSVPWDRLISARSGWLLPALPLIPATILGARRPEARPWLILIAFALILALGPWPEAPFGKLIEVEGESATRLPNPIYWLFYQFVPSMSRMHHANRWIALVTSGVVVLTALGLDRLEDWKAPAAPAALVTGMLWATWIGPWPMALSSFPGHVEARLRPCNEIVYVPQAQQFEVNAMHIRNQLDGLYWRQRYPAGLSPSLGVSQGAISDRVDAFSKIRVRAALSLIYGNAAEDDLRPGSCVVLADEGTSRPTEDAVRALTLRLGEPELLEVPAGIFSHDDLAHTFYVFRVNP